MAFAAGQRAGRRRLQVRPTASVAKDTATTPVKDTVSRTKAEARAGFASRVAARAKADADKAKVDAAALAKAKADAAAQAKAKATV